MKTKTETKLQQSSSKIEVPKSLSFNVESTSNEYVIITDEKEQVITHFRKIVYTQWLVKPAEWLTNGHIDAFQNLIYDTYKYQGFEGFNHPSRLEPSSIGRDFILNPETIHERPFVTILNAGKNHWVTLTNYNPHWVDKIETGLGVWFIYDSLNNAEFYANSIKPALKRLNEVTGTVTIMACDMPKQYGTDDCGLFALA